MAGHHAAFPKGVLMSEETDQEKTIAFLADPASHEGRPEVVRIDTHAAVVFLAGPLAYKLKRAVRFPFLDYTTREKRRVACEHEIERNRPFAPTIYIGVEDIAEDRATGRLRFGGGGPVVDHVVKMARFDETRSLDRVVDEEGLDDALAQALADTMVAAHSIAEPRGAGAWIADLSRYVEQNDAAFRADPELFPGRRSHELTEAARRALSELHALLEQRGRVGRVRLGHGDAHLGNIVLIDGEPVLFDAVEFDDTIATGDVLYDLAFLLMDLWERGERRGANRVFNRYFERAGEASDLDALAALPFFLMMRAAIRAKVTAAALRHQAPDLRARKEQAARRYFDWAGAFLTRSEPRLVAIGGLSGTGKSTLAKAIAPLIGRAPGALILRSDVLRKRLYGIAETEAAPAEAYSQGASDRVYQHLFSAADRAIAAGHSVILDAVFAKEAERQAAVDVARRTEIGFTGLWLEAPHDVMVDRVSSRRMDASDADAAIVARQLRYDLGTIDWHRIDAGGTVEAVVKAACAVLEIDAVD